MAKVVKRIVQKPKELKKERENWLSMQRLINVELQRIDPQYEIRELIKRPDGGIEFETSTEFKEKHHEEIARIFSLLELKNDDSKFVQAKYYMPRVIQKRVKQWATELGVPVSSLVAAILDERVREELN